MESKNMSYFSLTWFYMNIIKFMASWVFRTDKTEANYFYICFQDNQISLNMEQLWPLIKKKQTSLCNRRCEYTFQQRIGWQHTKQRKALKAMSLFSIWQQEIAFWLVKWSGQSSSVSWENSCSVRFWIDLLGKGLLCLSRPRKACFNIYNTQKSRQEF